MDRPATQPDNNRADDIGGTPGSNLSLYVGTSATYAAYVVFPSWADSDTVNRVVKGQGWTGQPKMDDQKTGTKACLYMPPLCM